MLSTTIYARIGTSDSDSQMDTDSDSLPSFVEAPAPGMGPSKNAADIESTSSQGATVVCLSPGHPSAEGDKYFEAILNRKVAWFLTIQLLEASYDVVLAVEDVPPQKLFFSGFSNEEEQLWSYLEVSTPEEKANRCNEAGADYLISIHHNYAISPVTNQTMVFYTMDENYRPVFGETRPWAESTAAQLGQVMETDESYAIADLERLGFPLGILANAEMPGILTEASFYSHPEERARLNDDFYLSSEAEAIFRAFTDHLDSRPTNANVDSTK
jgi:N-acetylmuramoyl-L-alanine amidase